jgi:hypothetical protein
LPPVISKLPIDDEFEFVLLHKTIDEAPVEFILSLLLTFKTTPVISELKVV